MLLTVGKCHGITHAAIKYTRKNLPSYKTFFSI